MGELGVWAFAYADRRNVAREFSRAAADAGCAGANSSRSAGVADREKHFRHLDGRITLHLERISVAFEKRRLGDGGDGWASSSDGGEPDRSARSDGNVSGPSAAQGYGRDSEARRRIEFRRHDPVLRRRESPVLPARRPLVAQPKADRQLSGF